MPGGGMAGSFKSTVWDYYLPTDVHEASYYFVLPDLSHDYLNVEFVLAGIIWNHTAVNSFAVNSH